MNGLIKRESAFIRLLISTTSHQRLALIKTISPLQMRAIVHIVYNVLSGNRVLSATNKKTVSKHKLAIRRFIAKDLSSGRRKQDTSEII